MPFQKTLLAASLVVLLSACISDKNNDSNPDLVDPVDAIAKEDSSTQIANDGTKNVLALGKVNVLVTNNLINQYAEAWVNIIKIEVQDVSDTSFTIFENANGQVVNLTGLTGVAQLLSTQSLPAGTYTTFEVTLGSEVTVVDATGTTQKLNFAGEGITTELDVAGSLIVGADQVISFALDFDLSQFGIDETGNIVPFVTASSDLNDLTAVNIDTSGVVNEIDDDTLIITPNESNIPLVVNLDNGIIVGSDTTVIEGDQIEVEGSFDLFSQTATASRIDIEIEAVVDAEDDVEIADLEDVVSQNNTVEIEGTIVSIDTNQIVVNVQEADFVPASNNISILLNTNPVFVRGSEQVLAVGQRVEVNGELLGGFMTATDIEIEGAGTGVNAANTVVEVEGNVIGLENNILTLVISQSNNINMVFGSSIVIDLSLMPANFVNTQCLSLNNIVDVKGTLDDINNFIPTLVKAEQCTATINTTSREVKLTGQVLSTDVNGFMSIQLSDSQNTALANTVLNVDLSIVDLEINGLNNTTLAVGTLVEIEATTDGVNLLVTEVEVMDSNESHVELDEVTGTVLEIANGTMLLSIRKADTVINTLTLNTSLLINMPVDFNNSVSQTSSQASIVNGDIVEVKGYFDGVNFNALSFSIETIDSEIENEETPAPII